MECVFKYQTSLNKGYYIQKMVRYRTGGEYLGNKYKLKEKYRICRQYKTSKETAKHIFKTSENKENIKSLEVIMNENGSGVA